MERFNFYCNILLAANDPYELKSTCDEMGGELTWFDTSREFNALMNRLQYYDHSDFNGHLYSGCHVNCKVHVSTFCPHTI